MSASFRYSRCGMALSIVFLSSLMPAPGQEPAKTAVKTPPTASPEVQVIPLKYADAQSLVQVLNNTFPKDSRVRVVSEPQTNSIIVQAATADMETVRHLIQQFDRRPTPPAAVPENLQNRLSIISMRSILPDQAFESALKLIADSNEFTIDRARRTLILNSRDDVRQRVEALVQRLEQESAPRQSKDIQVRVIWVLDDVPDMNRKSLQAPPSDMNDVLPALAKMGMTKPGLAGQLLVTTTSDHEFRVNGNTNVWNIKEEVRFSATGTYSDKKTGPELAISLRGHFEGGKSELFAIDSSMNIPGGKFVVLGMTPFQQATSAFVVQVMPKP